MIDIDIKINETPFIDLKNLYLFDLLKFVFLREFIDQPNHWATDLIQEFIYLT